MSAEALKVLVVDDSALMRRALSGILGQAGGFDVALARNGADALAQLDRVRPDVVTLDVNMPEMDGLTCLSRIMQSAPVPVVMVSSLTERGALATLEALELGAVDYVRKPGGTVTLDMSAVAEELVGKVRAAAAARPRSARPRVPAPRARSCAPPAGREVELVVVGASTGGPGLLADLLAELPARTTASVLVAQHMPASFTSALSRRLDGCCPLPVSEVTGPTAVAPGAVYVARGDADMVLGGRGGALMVRPVPASPAHRWHPSVDRLVESVLAVADPTRTVGVLLTGMGDDGAAQMSRLKEAGGRTIAESEESAVVWGMPGQLVARGGATLVLPAERIAATLGGWL